MEITIIYKIAGATPQIRLNKCPCKLTVLNECPCKLTVLNECPCKLTVLNECQCKLTVLNECPCKLTVLNECPCKLTDLKIFNYVSLFIMNFFHVPLYIRILNTCTYPGC